LSLETGVDGKIGFLEEGSYTSGIGFWWEAESGFHKMDYQSTWSFDGQPDLDELFDEAFFEFGVGPKFSLAIGIPQAKVVSATSTIGGGIRFDTDGYASLDAKFKSKFSVDLLTALMGLLPSSVVKTDESLSWELKYNIFSSNGGINQPPVNNDPVPLSDSASEINGRWRLVSASGTAYFPGFENPARIHEIEGPADIVNTSEQEIEITITKKGDVFINGFDRLKGYDVNISGGALQVKYKNELGWGLFLRARGSSLLNCVLVDDYELHNTVNLYQYLVYPRISLLQNGRLRYLYEDSDENQEKSYHLEFEKF
jgi:hypothetical protein